MEKRRHPWLVTMIGWIAVSGAVAAQDAHQHLPAGSSAPTVDAHRRVDLLLDEAEKVLTSGRGFGMAFAADQNGYPGPMHALELREQLALTAEQAVTLELVTQSMFDAARLRSRDLLDAEERLRQMFAGQTANDTQIESQARAIERLRADVRLIHLRAHLQTFDVLTAPQRQLYGQIRWGALTRSDAIGASDWSTLRP
jgi:Spy/CpxP family protein refolding chaperone